MGAQGGAAALRPWTIYGLEDRWPEAAGCFFIPKAVSAFAACVLDIDGREIASAMETVPPGGKADPDSAGAETATGMAELFGTMLRDGLMTSYARPVGGTGTFRLTTGDWDHDGVEDAIATGTLALPREEEAANAHWVFVDAHELGVLLDIYAPPATPDPIEALRERCDRLVEIVLESLVPIAARRGRRIASAPALPHRPSRELLDALFPNATRQLDTDDQERMIQLSVPWLIERFKADVGPKLLKEDFEREALELLAPYMTGNLFRAVWARAAVGEFKSRREPGQRGVAAARAAASPRRGRVG